MPSAAVASVETLDAQPRAKRNYSRIIEQTWIWSVVGYTLVRFFIAWGAFSDHGANVWVFGLIDVGSAWPYAKGVAIICKRAAEGSWARLPVPIVITIALFFSPYAYLWFAAGEMPAGMRVGLAICVTVLFLAAGSGIFAKSRKLRRETREAVIDIREPASAVVHLASVGDADAQVIDLSDHARPHELMIDLTGDEVTIERTALHG